MRQLQGEPEEAIPQLRIIGDIQDLVDRGSRIAAVQDRPAAGLHYQHNNHNIPYHLNEEEGKKLISLEDIQSFGIKNRFQDVKVVEENEQKGYGYDAQ